MRTNIKKERICEICGEKNNAIVARLKSENFYLKDFAPQKHLFEKYGIIKGGGLGD